MLYAETLGFRPITTPVYSPESKGMAEAFVYTIKRDYVGGADLSDAQNVIQQLPGWIEDYNRIAPHSALGFLSPKEFRAQQYTELRVSCLSGYFSTLPDVGVSRHGAVSGGPGHPGCGGRGSAFSHFRDREEFGRRP